MEGDSEFPWQEFGQYQNLVAQMPTLLEIETPDPRVRNKIVDKIQSQSEDVQVEEKLDLEDAPDLTEFTQDSKETVEVIEDENLIIEEEEIIPLDLEEEIELDDPKSEVNSGISIKEHEKPELDLSEFKTAKPKVAKDQTVTPLKRGGKKEVRDKPTNNYVSKFPKDEKVGRLGSNKLLIIAAVGIVIILVFLLIMYLGLSSEIDDNKQEIQKLKQRIGIALIQEDSSPLESEIV